MRTKITHEWENKRLHVILGQNEGGGALPLSIGLEILFCSHWKAETSLCAASSSTHLSSNSCRWKKIPDISALSIKATIMRQLDRSSSMFIAKAIHKSTPFNIPTQTHRNDESVRFSKFKITAFFITFLFNEYSLNLSNWQRNNSKVTATLSHPLFY